MDYRVVGGGVVKGSPGFLAPTAWHGLDFYGFTPRSLEFSGLAQHVWPDEEEVKAAEEEEEEEEEEGMEKKLDATTLFDKPCKSPEMAKTW